MGEVVYIRSSNVGKVIADLNKLGINLERLDKPMKEVGKTGLAGVKSYPVIGAWYNGQITSASQRPGAKYKRTFALQRSWNGRINKKGKNWTEYIIYQKGKINPKSGRDARSYMPYVQGSEQTSNHRQWWTTLNEWREIMPPYIDKAFERFLLKIIRGF